MNSTTRKMYALPSAKSLIARCLCWLLGLCISTNAFAALPVIDFASLLQLGHQLTELRMQTKLFEQTLQSLSDAKYQWSNAQLMLNQGKDCVQQMHGLSFGKVFQKAYPGYQVPSHYRQQYQQNVDLTQNTFSGVLQMIKEGNDSFYSENQRLSHIQQQVQTGVGQVQVLQSSAELTSEVVSQVQLLRQSVMAQSNAQTAYYANQIQDEANGRAEMEKIICTGSQSVPVYGSSGHHLQCPDF